MRMNTKNNSNVLVKERKECVMLKERILTLRQAICKAQYHWREINNQTYWHWLKMYMQIMFLWKVLTINPSNLLIKKQKSRANHKTIVVYFLYYFVSICVVIYWFSYKLVCVCCFVLCFVCLFWYVSFI